MDQQSGCPINTAAEILGDRWSILILRDVIFSDRRYFRALLNGSTEGIASNILADRLVRLVGAGILTRGTGARGQRIRYSLTEAGIQTLPIIYALGNWGLDWRPSGDGARDRQKLMRDQGPTFLEDLMEELRVRHLGTRSKPHDSSTPLERLDSAYASAGEETTMKDTTPQRAEGKVLWHFTISLDGFVAGPNHEMDWLTGFTVRPGLVDEYVRTTGAVLAGRNGFDSAIGDSRPYGGAWQGPIFVLTHHPEDARQSDDITFLNCPVEEAVQIALDAADGKNVEVFSPNIGGQLLRKDLIDEIDLHIAPVLLGEGIRLYDNPGSTPIYLQRLPEAEDSTRAVNVRYRPAQTK